MKIGICGTHCAGKTTLVRDLRGVLDGHTCFIEDAACDFKREDRIFIETQRNIFMNQVRRESEGLGKFISDRTVIDNLAYALVCDSKYSDMTITMRTILEDVGFHLKYNPYDVIFFVDEYFPLEDNGNRDMDDNHQRFMFIFLKTLIRMYSMQFNIPVVYVKGDRKIRVETIKREITRFNKVV